MNRQSRLIWVMRTTRSLESLDVLVRRTADFGRNNSIFASGTVAAALGYCELDHKTLRVNRAFLQLHSYPFTTEPPFGCKT